MTGGKRKSMPKHQAKTTKGLGLLFRSFSLDWSMKENPQFVQNLFIPNGENGRKLHAKTFET